MAFLWLIVLLSFFLNRCVVCADYHLCHNCFATDTHTQHSFQFRQVSQKWCSNLSNTLSQPLKTNTVLSASQFFISTLPILYRNLANFVSQPCQLCIATLQYCIVTWPILYCNLANFLQCCYTFALLPIKLIRVGRTVSAIWSNLLFNIVDR